MSYVVPKGFSFVEFCKSIEAKKITGEYKPANRPDAKMKAIGSVRPSRGHLRGRGRVAIDLKTMFSVVVLQKKSTGFCSIGEFSKSERASWEEI